MAKQTGYMQITLREFDQSCIRNAPDDAFLQGFQLKAITASGERLTIHIAPSPSQAKFSVMSRPSLK